MPKETVPQKTLKVIGRLRKADRWDTFPIHSFRSFISTFRCCYYQTEVVYYVSHLLGTDQQIWNLVVTNMREEAGGRIMNPVEVEEIELEIRDDVTSEIEGLVDLSEYAKNHHMTVAQMRRVFDIPQTPEERRTHTLEYLDREIYELQKFRESLTKK